MHLRLFYTMEGFVIFSYDPSLQKCLVIGKHFHSRYYANCNGAFEFDVTCTPYMGFPFADYKIMLAMYRLQNSHV